MRNWGKMQVTIVFDTGDNMRVKQDPGLSLLPRLDPNPDRFWTLLGGNPCASYMESHDINST